MTIPQNVQIKIISAATTNVSTSLPFGMALDGQSITLVCNGLAGSETATIQIYDPISSTFVNWLPPSTQAKQLTASINSISIVDTHGTFQVVKSSSVASVGVALICVQP